MVVAKKWVSFGTMRALAPVIVGVSFWACGGNSEKDEGGESGGGTSGASGGAGARGGASGAEGGTSAGGERGSSAGGAAGKGGSGATGGFGAIGGSGVIGGASGAGGGPCRGLECDKPTCTMGNCTQMPCANGANTTVSGTVYDPAGMLPLSNALVYVPLGPVPPLATGASCNRCDQARLDQVSAALTRPDGRFNVPDMPVGADIPLVIQVGKWRRQITIPNVVRCADTALTDREQTSLPSNKSEGDIPRIAITTGGGDSMECLPRRMGLEDSEFTTDSGNGRVHLFAGTDGSTQSVSTKALDSGEALPHADTLWSSADSLGRYDIVIFSCEGDAQENVRPASARQAVFDYTSSGGRVLASHWHYRWISSGPAPFPDVAIFTDRDNPPNPSLATINLDPAKGQSLAEWLLAAGGSALRGELEVIEPRHNVDAVNPEYATEWMRVNNSPVTDMPAVQALSFNTPLDVDENLQCGRVIYTDLHVAITRPDVPADAPGMPFPSHCAVRELSPQEKAVEFMLFDLSACVQSDDEPPLPPL